MEAISTDQAPQAIGPYSQGMSIGDFVFLSGQIPMTPEGHLVQGSISKQTQQVIENVRAVLIEIGLGLDSVVKVTLFVKDLGQFSKINEVYAQYFPQHRPARSCVEVARLPRDVQIEMEVIAYKK